jgi:hypothetical protein
MQSAMVQATQAEWRKLPQVNLSCVDEVLRQRGISLQALITSGVLPSDTRISDVLTSCRSQSDLQQLANTQFEPTTEPSHISPGLPQTARPSGSSFKYRVEKIPLGSTIPFESKNYKEYQCRPSDQFTGFTWCQKQRTERVPRGAYRSSYSMLHSEDGRVFYLNRELDPAFFDPGEVTGDIDRLSRAFGEQPRSIAMPQRAPGVSGVIAYWGDVILEALNAAAMATLASGHSPGGILADFAGNFQESIRQSLPIYRVAGGPGFVWSANYDANGRGRLRFFAIDASTLGASPADAREAKPYQPATTPPAPDPWKDCQSSDTETRLAGCTKVIDAKGLDRVRLADAFDGRCSAYNQQRQYQLALSDCKTAIDLNPRYSYGYANLGATYLGLNDPASALSALNRAVALKTNFIWSRLSRAKAFEASGSNNEDALREYQYALLIDPSNQIAKDGVLRLMAGSTPTSQIPESCLGDVNEQARYIAVSATASTTTAMESAASAISSSAQTYRSKLTSQLAKVDQLTREKEANDRQQAVLAGSPEDRKKMINDVQRLTEANTESEARLKALSEKISEREGQLIELEAAKARQARLKEIGSELAKLRSARAAAERDVHQKTSERDDALSRAQQKAVEIANAVLQSEKIAAAKENAESCVRQIKASIDALDQTADGIRQKQAAQAAKALQVSAENLLSDLSEFAQKNSSLVPLEVGPLVAALKGALSTKDSDKTSNAFSSLQRRLDEIPEFKNFRLSREEVRQQAAKAELDQLTDTARNISDFVESYARRNITSDNAQDLVKLRGSLSEALVTPETESLKLAISASEKELERLQLEPEYRDYRAKHRSNPANLSWRPPSEIGCS